MKKVAVIISLLTISCTMFSQENEPSAVLTKGEYLRKSRHQRTAATLLLCGGVITNTIATVISMRQVGDNIRGIVRIWDPSPPPAKDNRAAAAALFVVGTAQIAISIGMFVEAGNNRRKAKTATVSFKSERTFQLQQSGLVTRIVPAISLAVRL